MRATCAANRVGLCQFQHDGLNVSDRYRPDYTAALVANDIRSVFACADYQAAATVHGRDIFMWDDRQMVECRVHADMLPALSLTFRSCAKFWLRSAN